MKKAVLKIVLSVITIGLVMFFATTFQSCRKPGDDHSTLKKPNIYLYPTENIFIIVNIAFPKGGNIINSIPHYNNSWNVFVDTTGKIDNQYDYLFYESNQPDEWQYKTGWIIEKDSLLPFFQNNMQTYGFNVKEIKDFTDFWIPRMTNFKYYLLYPQETQIIEKLVQINFSIKPDNYLRLFYAIKGTNEIIAIEKHSINNKFKREDFYVTEWGVIME